MKQEGSIPSSITMTVVSVVGLINSREIVCVQTEPDVWECRPGDNPDGKYVTEFWATDDAGNIGYKLAILYVYDGRCVKIEWVEDNVEVKYIKDDFDIVDVKDSFDLTFIEIPIELIPIDDDFDILIVKCEGALA